jgi:glycogen synthase
MHIVLTSIESPSERRADASTENLFALAKALRSMGYRVTVIVPKYPNKELGSHVLARRLHPIRLELPDPSLGGSSSSSSAPSTTWEVVAHDSRTTAGIDIIWLEQPELWTSPRAFAHHDAHHETSDNGAAHPVEQAVALFGSAVARIVHTLDVHCEVLHLHGWPCRSVPRSLERETHEASSPEAPRPPVVWTLDELARHRHPFDPTTEDALRYAGALVLTSTLHREHIESSSEWQHSDLQNALREHLGKLMCVAPGLDVSVWNPVTDALLPSRYDPLDLAGKDTCKTTLQHHAALEVALEIPLVGIVLELVHSASVPQLSRALHEALRNDCQFLVLSEHESLLTQELTALQSSWPDRLALHPITEPASLHTLFGGADFIAALPAHETGYGIVKQAQRYGSVPIAPRMHPERDWLVDCDAALATGSALVYDDARELGAAFQRACAAFAHPRWPDVRARIMRLDHSWDRAAKLHVYLYESLIRAHAENTLQTGPEALTALQGSAR